MRNSEPDPVYLRGAREISPGLVGLPPRTPRIHDFLPPSACGERSRTALRPPPFFAVHQWTSALERPNPPRFSKLFQRPRPSQAGQARSASRSAVTISDLSPASGAGRRAELEGCPGKRRAISVSVHYSPRCSMSGNGAGAEGAGYAQFAAPDPFAALWLVVPGPPPLAPPSQGWERRASQTQKEWRHRRHLGAISAPSGRHNSNP